MPTDIARGTKATEVLLRMRSKHLPVAAVAAALTIVAAVIVLPLVTGRDWPSWTGLNGKTIWDFAELIVVPLSLALIAYLFSNRQRMDERELARAQREQDLRIADQRRQSDFENALNRDREEALQLYLSVMTELLLDRDVKDRKVATIARARTMSLLPRLDGRRRAAVLGFLSATNLIGIDAPVIDLSGAELSDMPAEGMHLAGVNLARANLADSRLAHSSLRESNLSGSNLSGVDLTGADLFKTSFRTATLTGTTFSDAVIFGADFSPPPVRPHMSLAVQNNRAQKEQRDWVATLSTAHFQRARYDFSTKWPSGFDPAGAGAVDESD